MNRGMRLLAIAKRFVNSSNCSSIKDNRFEITNELFSLYVRVGTFLSEFVKIGLKICVAIFILNLQTRPIG